MSNDQDAPQPEAGTEFDFGMTDLEERLKAPGGEELQVSIVRRLEELGKETKERLDQGLQPDEYAIAETTYGALAAAHDIMVNFPANETDRSE